MRRNSHLTAIAGFVLSAILLAAGGLLNAFGWWKVSQLTYIASLIAFGLGGLTLLASLFGLTIGRRLEIVHEVIDGTPVTKA
jgi:hypothetical protein